MIHFKIPSCSALVCESWGAPQAWRHLPQDNSIHICCCPTVAELCTRQRSVYEPNSVNFTYRTLLNLRRHQRKPSYFPQYAFRVGIYRYIHIVKEPCRVNRSMNDIVKEADVSESYPMFFRINADMMTPFTIVHIVRPKRS